MDFKNAFPTMSHEMVAAALGLMCIPFLYIRLILHLLRAPYLYSVGKGYVPGVYHHPHTTGTGIGAPRPHAVNGAFPRALCFWVVVALGTILGFVHCDALFILTRQVPYVFGAGTRRLHVML